MNGGEYTIAAPWPNRIADGCYSWNGAIRQLPLKEPDRQTALHGLAFDRLWTAQKHDGGRLTQRCELEQSEGHPFALVLEVEYGLADDGLHSRLTATNTGAVAAPYGACPHPLSRGGTGPAGRVDAVLAGAVFPGGHPGPAAAAGARIRGGARL